MRSPYYAMKRRLGGEKFTPREKLTWNYYPCPGCLPHQVSERRREILFEHFQKRPQSSYVVYWRSHPDEYRTLLKYVGSPKV